MPADTIRLVLRALIRFPLGVFLRRAMRVGIVRHAVSLAAVIRVTLLDVRLAALIAATVVRVSEFVAHFAPPFHALAASRALSMTRLTLLAISPV